MARQKRRTPALAGDRGNVLRATETYQNLPRLQELGDRWSRHAMVLLASYWRTGELRHLQAFNGHVVGMRLRIMERRGA